MEPISSLVGPEKRRPQVTFGARLRPVSSGKQARLGVRGARALGLAMVLDRRVKGTDLRREYRDYAAQKARLQEGPRVDGDFDYYEVMSQWERSGHFDLDLDAKGTQPELNPSYYNGLIWTWRSASSRSVSPLVRGILSTNRQFATTSSMLTELAYRVNRTPGGRSTYADIIRKSDDRFRQARNAVGFVIANHLVSAADAFVSGRAGLI